MCHHLNWLQIWPPDDATCIDYKFSHQMASLASVVIFATRWCHSHQLKIGPPSDTTCICSKLGHQVAPLALVPKLAIRWRHLQILQICPPLVASHYLGLPYWHCQLVLSWYLHQPESHKLSFKNVAQSVSDNRTHRSDPRDTWVR